MRIPRPTGPRSSRAPAFIMPLAALCGPLPGAAFALPRPMPQGLSYLLYRGYGLGGVVTSVGVVISVGVVTSVATKMCSQILSCAGSTTSNAST